MAGEILINSDIIKKLKAITPEEQKIIHGESGIDRNLYMDSTADVINSKKILSAGKQIAIRPHTRFVHFPKHSHDFVEMVYMCKGTTTHLINGIRVELKAGELLLLCQGATQEIFPAGEDDIAVNFVVLPEFFEGALQMMGEEDTPLRRFLVDCLTNERHNNGYLHFEVADILPIQNLLENLIWTLVHDTPNKRNINQTTMGLLFLLLINHTDRLNYRENEDALVRTLRYVEENYKCGSLTELSKLLHYDLSVLSREIKNKTGRTYTELVQEKRISQACFLLKNTNLSVEEIADRVGYENASFFYRIFKSKYGLSPRKYRNL